MRARFRRREASPEDEGQAMPRVRRPDQSLGSQQTVDNAGSDSVTTSMLREN